MDGVKPIEEVRAEGARRRRLLALREALYHRDLKRWNIALGVGGGLLAFIIAPFTAYFSELPLVWHGCYAAVGAAAGWLLSDRDLHTFGGLCCYGGSLVGLAVIGMSLGLQPPDPSMALAWLAFLVVGGTLGLVVQLREWRIERALDRLDDADVAVHDGSASAAVRAVPTPELDPNLHRPGHLQRPPRRDDTPIAFAGYSDDAQDDEAPPVAEAEPPTIIDDEDFRPPGG